MLAWGRNAGVQRAVLGCGHVRGFAFACKWGAQSALALRSAGCTAPGWTESSRIGEMKLHTLETRYQNGPESKGIL